MADNYEQEKAVYIQKLTAQIETIDKILNTNTLDLINGEMEGKLRELKQAAEQYKRKLEKNEFEIAIVGLEKAGKSTFANAMMGNDILPSDDAQCTFTSTKICSGGDTATVVFYSNQEFAEKFKEKLLTMKIDTNSYNYSNLTLSSYQRLFESLDASIKDKYENDLNEDVKRILTNKNTINTYLGKGEISFSGVDQLTSEDFKKFIKIPAYALSVKEITIHSSKMASPNDIIYDVPGFDSTTKEHPKQTIEFMCKADAIVLIASAYKPTFTKPVAELLRGRTDSDGVSFYEKMFVFANRADNATDLNKNMETIKKELRKYNLLKENDFHRLVPGSALAFLEKTGAINSNMTNGYSEDGIEKIRELLKSYNQNERFEILKRRINQKQNEIYDVFKELFKENDVDTSADYSQIRTELTIEIAAKSGKIIKKLEAFRGQLEKVYPIKREISHEVKEKVNSDICREKFSVSQEELDEAHNKFPDTEGVVHTTDIDVYIRGNKSKQIYKEFASIIVELAKSHHSNVIEKIKDIFKSELQIPQGSDGEKVVETILENQKINISSDGGYYKPLIERFAKDLFEILMETPFTSMDRWQRFEKGFANFSSLAMYDEGKSKTNSGNNQPLYYALLFQQRDRYEKNSIINDVLNTIKTVLNFAPTHPIIKLVENVVFSGKKFDVIENAVKSLVNTFNRPNTNQTQEQKENNIINKLKGLATPNTATEDYITEASYDKFFQGKRAKELPIISKEIDEDIDILHDALCNVVVNAINIEKAFLAFEFGNFQNLLDFLNDRKSWPKFVSDNLRLITPSQYNDMENEVQRQMSRQNILADIKLLLDQMNNNNLTLKNE